MRNARGALASAVLVGTCASAVLLGACASPSNQVNATPTSAPAVSDAPTSAPATELGTKPPTKPPAATTYPKTCRAYSEAVLSAWKNHDLGRLGDLSITMVQDQIISIPGPPNMNWKFIRVTPQPGLETCDFYNGSGDVIRLGISTAVMGQAHAALKVHFEAPVYPNDSNSYVIGLMNAWKDGNEPLMLLYSKQSIVNVLNQTPKPGNLSLILQSSGAGLEVVTVDSANGLSLEFHVSIALLGLPHAVVNMVY